MSARCGYCHELMDRDTKKPDRWVHTSTGDYGCADDDTPDDVLVGSNKQKIVDDRDLSDAAPIDPTFDGSET